MAGRFCSPKGKKEETSFVSEATPRETQYSTKCGRKVLEEWQQQRQNKCAMSELVGVAGLKCEDVQNLTVSLEHMSPNTLYCSILLVEQVTVNCLRREERMH